MSNNDFPLTFELIGVFYDRANPDKVNALLEKAPMEVNFVENNSKVVHLALPYYVYHHGSSEVDDNTMKTISGGIVSDGRYIYATIRDFQANRPYGRVGVPGLTQTPEFRAAAAASK